MNSRNNHRPTKRVQTTNSYSPWFILLLLAIICFVFYAGYYIGNSLQELIQTQRYLNELEDEDSLAVSHDSLGPVYTYNGKNTMRIYVFTDPDTEQQYLVNDHGGITPRLKHESIEQSISL